MAAWVQSRGYVLTSTDLWKGTAFPPTDEFDGLFILGGPMNVYEVDKYPWLAPEQHFVARAISERKPIVGVCLGAQLLAAVLGGSVTKNPHKEIGWHSVRLTSAGRDSVLFQEFPDEFMAFHWHGDHFSIPSQATHLARSDACEEQAFIYENRVVGLQFHLESTVGSIAALIEHCGDEISCPPYVQDPAAMGDCTEYLPTAHRLLNELLDALCVSSECPSSPIRS